MELLKQCLLIGLAGSVGALARFIVGRFLQNQLAESFPIGTMIVNLSGCFILGLLMSLGDRNVISNTTKLAIGVGFVGAYTTFSTWMYDSVALMEKGQFIAAILNIFLSVFLGLIVVLLGLVCGRRV